MENDIEVQYTELRLGGEPYQGPKVPIIERLYLA